VTARFGLNLGFRVQQAFAHDCDVFDTLAFEQVIYFNAETF
jgi:hypothetical protein